MKKIEVIIDSQATLVAELVGIVEYRAPMIFFTVKFETGEQFDYRVPMARTILRTWDVKEGA